MATVYLKLDYQYIHVSSSFEPTGKQNVFQKVAEADYAVSGVAGRGFSSLGPQSIVLANDPLAAHQFNPVTLESLPAPPGEPFREVTLSRGIIVEHTFDPNRVVPASLIPDESVSFIDGARGQPDYAWLMAFYPDLYDDESNVINYNELTQAQQNSIAGQSSIYQSKDGADRVILPDETRSSNLTPLTDVAIAFNRSFVFDAGLGDDTVIGSSSTDRIAGKGGMDSLSGEAGDDRFFAYRPEDIVGDTIDGGSGIDRLRIEGAGSFDLGRATLTSIERTDVGTNSQVSLTLNNSMRIVGQIGVAGSVRPVVSDVSIDAAALTSGEQLVFLGRTTAINGGIEGFEGSDVVRGGAGEDQIHGGKGNDQIRGEDGDDLLSGDENDDVINGGSGADTILGIRSGFTEEGRNLLDGGAGLDEDIVEYADASTDFSILKMSLPENVDGLQARIQNTHGAEDVIVGWEQLRFLDQPIRADDIIKSGFWTYVALALDSTNDDVRDWITGALGDDPKFERVLSWFNYLDRTVNILSRGGLAGSESVEAAGRAIFVEIVSTGADGIIDNAKEVLTAISNRLPKPLADAASEEISIAANNLKLFVRQTSAEAYNAIQRGTDPIVDDLAEKYGESYLKLEERVLDEVTRWKAFFKDAPIEIETGTPPAPDFNPPDLPPSPPAEGPPNQVPLNLTGTSGVNVLVGGTASDFFAGGPGNDVIVGGPDIDTVSYDVTLSNLHVDIVNAARRVFEVSTSDGKDVVENVERLAAAGKVYGDDPSSVGVDVLYYLALYNDVGLSDVDPGAHYRDFGWKEGRDPNAAFSTEGYLAVNKDVREAGINPLEHYNGFGWHENRDPGLSFDTAFYIARNTDVRAAGINPLEHYLNFGLAEHRSAAPAVFDAHPHDGFDRGFYLAANSDVAEAAVDPTAHYILHGWREGRDPNAYFSTSAYFAANPDVAAAGIDPLAHFNEFGWLEHRSTGGLLDTEAYLVANLDVAAARVNPLDHWLQHGINEGRYTGAGLLE